MIFGLVSPLVFETSGHFRASVLIQGWIDRVLYYKQRARGRLYVLGLVLIILCSTNLKATEQHLYRPLSAHTVELLL